MSNGDSAPVPPSSPPKPPEPSIQPPQRPPFAPPLIWRLGSSLVIGLTGFLSRSFLLACTSSFEVHGLEKFLDLLDEREDVTTRERGLITVSNHVSVIDDPLIWGALPFRYMWSPSDNRWSLGSHDLMFRNRATSLFFSLGQCLPTHRIQHSQYGGLFQPIMTETIKLLSTQPFAKPALGLEATESKADVLHDHADPFSDPTVPPLSPTYSTTGLDSFPSPAYYPSRRHAWVHVFPEGRIHQHPGQVMRYFRWGTSRLILESEPCPDVVPMWIEGPQQAMHESRTFPRPVPRPGANVRIEFGDRLDVDSMFGEVRRKWKKLVDESKRRRPLHKEPTDDDGRTRRKWDELGVVEDEWLRYGDEAVQLRVEVARMVREEVLKLRRQREWPEETAGAELASNWGEHGGGFGERRQTDLQERS